MIAATMPRVTFGMIVLNGEPFTRYNLRALYPFAHQIIVVEGAAPAATASANPQGHSTDDTLAVLRDFQAREDPEGKLLIVTAEDEGHPDGFWPGEKDQQSQAYARRATGDYLWQVDSDEFYRPEDVAAVLAMLRADPTIAGASFKQLTFWGGFDYTVDGWYLRRGAAIYQRLFRWGPGYRYVTHRPPTVHDTDGRSMRDLRWMDGAILAARGIRLYHYSLVFPGQVLRKSAYYGAASWANRPQAERWAHEVYGELKRPYRVHNVYEHPSWLERFRGRHPPAIEQLWAALNAGRPPIQMRRTDDIERLLDAPWYGIGRAMLKILDPMELHTRLFAQRWLLRAKLLLTDPSTAIRKLRRKLRARQP